MIMMLAGERGALNSKVRQCAKVGKNQSFRSKRFAAASQQQQLAEGFACILLFCVVIVESAGIPAPASLAIAIIAAIICSHAAR